jgi:hypothetical protein
MDPVMRAGIARWDPVPVTEERTRVGPWTLHEQLGSGGNAVVWKATRSDAEAPVALKVIKEHRVEREPYRRFVREIQFQQEHQEFEGLLPLIGAYLPEQPSKRDRAWLAMPIATPIAKALTGRPLQEVIDAVAVIADTLARLESEFNVGHRDIKPGNLYALDGSWLVGDFGLIALPDMDGLTTSGRPLGPAHYTAYELILNPAEANPHPADVYSLGKTLWVLATDQAFPPEGNQPVGTRGFEIGDFRPHPRSGVLDQEVDLMTRLHPEERPSKRQVARDLIAWKELASERNTFDVTDARSRLRVKLGPALSSQDILDQQKELAYVAVRRLQELTEPLNEGLKTLYPRTQVDLIADELTQEMKTHLYLGNPREIAFRWQRCTLVAPFEMPVAITLRMSRSLELQDDGLLILRLRVLVGLEGLVPALFWWDMEPGSAPVGSVEAEKLLETGVSELSAALKQGIDIFVENLPTTPG